MVRVGRHIAAAVVGLMISSLVLADEYWVIASFTQEQNAEQSLRQWTEMLGAGVTILSESKPSGASLHRVVVPKEFVSRSQLEMVGVSPWQMKVSSKKEPAVNVPVAKAPEKQSIADTDVRETDIGATRESKPASSPVIATPDDTSQTVTVQGAQTQDEGTDWQKKLLEDYCSEVPKDDKRLQDMCAVWLKGPAGD